MPDLAALLQAPSITALELECLQDLQPSDCSELGLSQGTARISAAKAQGRLDQVLQLTADPQAKALLLSCGAEGAAPLLASAAAYGDSKLNNKELRVLLRLRLGMLPHPGAPSSGICQRQGCGKPVDACGLHHLLCAEKGKGGMSGSEIAWVYNGLHDAEKAELSRVATSMQAGMDALLPLVMNRWGHYYLGFKDFAECFDEVGKKVSRMCAAIRDENRYFYAPETLAWCLAELKRGLVRLEAVEHSFREAGKTEVFEQIKAQADVWRQAIEAYADAWRAIKAFDKTNTLAWVQRQRGHHAFEPAPKADMAA
jgi:hypothetical protein